MYNEQNYQGKDHVARKNAENLQVMARVKRMRMLIREIHELCTHFNHSSKANSIGGDFALPWPDVRCKMRKGKD